MPRRPFLPVLATGVLALALGACTGSGEPEPATPDGWQRVTSGALSFAVPGDWVEVGQVDGTWTVGWSDDADPGADSVLLVGAPLLGEDGAQAGLDAFVAGAQVGGWGYRSTDRSTPVDTESLEVARNDFTYDDVSGVVWSAADPRGGVTVGLQLTGRDLPEDLLDGIEQSIAVDREAQAS